MTFIEAENTFTEPLYRINSKVVIALDKPWSNIPAEERTLLSKILGALRLTLDSVQVISATSPNFGKWAQAPAKMIVFGKVDFLHSYEPGVYMGVPTVVSESLTDLLPNDAARKQLWLALKQLFGL